MKLIRFLTIANILLVAVAACAAEDKDLTKSEFYKLFAATYDKARGVNRRHISKTQELTDGKLTWTEEWQYEYDGPDRIHYVHITTFDGKTRRTEEIDIGKTGYCKRNDGPWEISRGCIGGSTSGSPPGDTRYSLNTTKLDGKDVTLLREYTIYKDTYSKNKDTEGLSFGERKLWIDKNGFLVRTESTKGLVDTGVVKSSTIDTYEYDPKITVEAPIKS